MATLNAEVNKAMKDPEVGEKLGSQGVEWVGGTPEQALDGGYIRSEIRKWAKVEETSGAKPEG